MKSERSGNGRLLAVLMLILPAGGWAQTAGTPSGGWQGAGEEWARGEASSQRPASFQGNRYAPPPGQPVYRPLDEDEGAASVPAGAPPSGGGGFVPSGYGEGTPPGPLPEDLAVPSRRPEADGRGRWNGAPGPAGGRGGLADPRWPEGRGTTVPPAGPSSAPGAGEEWWQGGERPPRADRHGQAYSASPRGWGGSAPHEERWLPPSGGSGYGYYPPPETSPYGAYPERAPAREGWAPRPPATGYRFPGGWFGLPGAAWSPPWEGSGWNVPGWNGGGYPAADGYPYGYEPGYYGYDRGYSPREYPPGYGYGPTGRW